MAAMPLAELAANHTTVVRTPQAAVLTTALLASGHVATRTADGEVTAADVTADVVGLIAAQEGVTVLGLAEQRDDSSTSSTSSPATRRQWHEQAHPRRDPRARHHAVVHDHHGDHDPHDPRVHAARRVRRQACPDVGDQEYVHRVLSISTVSSPVLLGVGIAAMAGEFRHGTSVPNFLISPHRREIVVAKLITITGLGAVVGATSFGLAVAVALPALDHKGVHHLAGDTPQMWIGATLATALFGALGVALGSITRNVVIAIIAWVAASAGIATWSVRRRDI